VQYIFSSSFLSPSQVEGITSRRNNRRPAVSATE
jgi:hypothetical protein